MEGYHRISCVCGQTYLNENGNMYVCIVGGEDPMLERVPDGWKLIAHDVMINDSTNKIYWGYSTGGHWENGKPKNYIAEDK